MKKHVLFGSKSGARLSRTFAPEKKTMRRQKARCNQSCFRGSRKAARKTSVGAAKKKCRYVTVHSTKLRTESQARFICTHPAQPAKYRATDTSATRSRRRSLRRPAPGC